MTRAAYQESLAKLEQMIQGEGDLVARAVHDAVTALLNSDDALAGEVIAFDDQIDAAHHQVELAVERLLALQAPVAGDLRLILAILHVNHNLERMGDQCVNIAKLMRLIRETALPDDVTALFAEMGSRTEHMVRVALDCFAARDVERAETLIELDEPIDRGNRDMVGLVIAHNGNEVQREAGIRATQITRCLERIGDNAVDIGEQTAFLVTGEVREFEDASHPSPT
ncbi:MAG: phosphate transport system protein [Gaiellales bacterium]|jgi:phosphate transport system protein|nr:phosphate transport system protein [Gaiellales bacterium]MDX6592443.1 phosphate transport system protein [Gaiellales bacterium]